MKTAVECSILPGLMPINFSYLGEEFAMVGMDYCPLGSLNKYVNDPYENNEDMIKSFFKQMLLIIRGLKRKGVVHRNIKPENILIDRFGMLRLSDFGLAKEADDHSDLVSNINAMGTMRYLSPELENGRPQSEKSDVWSLGAILLELAFGRASYTDIDMRKMNNGRIRNEFETIGGFSDKMVKLLEKCFERDENNRATIEELLDNDWLKFSGKSIVAQSISTVQPGNNN